MFLSPAVLASLPPQVGRPRYDRTRLAPGIVHLGVGAFMRAHLAEATEAAIHADGNMDWGIVGVSLRRTDTRDALEPQHGLYTLAARDQRGDSLRVMGCLMRVLVAPESPAAVLAAIAHPATRIVSLSVTEKAYPCNPVSGGLEADNADVIHDLAAADSPRGAIGFTVHGLARRRAAGHGPLTLLSLDNLPNNGDTLARLVDDFARRIDLALARWIKDHCTMPNSMVDRIVPRTTDADRRFIAEQIGYCDAWPVVAESFFDWVVEDRFAAGRPAWDLGGVRFVDSARPWETLKLRMVNGSHSAIAYLGAMAGWQTVDVAIAQAPLFRFVDAMMREEIEPTLQPLPGLDLGTYRARLLQRFSNPALAHRTQQIASDGSQKLPQRLLDTVRDRLSAGKSIGLLGLAIAGWLHYLRGRDEAGISYAIDDPLAAALADLSGRANACADTRVRADHLMRFAPVFGDLAGHRLLTDAVAPALDMLRKRGVRETLAWCSVNTGT